MSVRQAEFGHHDRLGLILGADDLDHAIKVQIGNQITVEQLDPVVDLAKPVLRPPDQHFDLVTDPARQHFLQRKDARRAIGVEHIHVQRDANLELGQPEQAFHQHIGIDGARPRFDDDADRFIRFITDIGEDRQFLVVDDRGDGLDQLALLHLVGNFGDDRDPGAAPLVLDLPARADAERPPARRIGFGNDGGAVDDLPARRQIGALHMFEKRRNVRVGLLDEECGRVDDLGDVRDRIRSQHASRPSTARAPAVSRSASTSSRNGRACRR